MQVKVTFEAEKDHGKTTLMSAFRQMLEANGIESVVEPTDDASIETVVVDTCDGIQQLKAYSFARNPFSALDCVNPDGKFKEPNAAH